MIVAIQSPLSIGTATISPCPVDYEVGTDSSVKSK